jgi:hypothetical protein
VAVASWRSVAEQAPREARMASVASLKIELRKLYHGVDIITDSSVEKVDVITENDKKILLTLSVQQLLISV